MSDRETRESMPCSTISTIDAIRRLLEALPDETSRKEVLSAVLENRCKRCLDYDPQGQFWCCHDSRG